MWQEWGHKKNACRLLVGKPEGKKPLGRPRRRWVDIKMNLRETGWGGADCAELVYDRDQGPVKGSCKHGNEPSGSIKSREVPKELHNWQHLRKGSTPWS
jgi:hypothetical protein